ncbi:MAG: serine hydrolase [Pseudomonadota bacterium]
MYKLTAMTIAIFCLGAVAAERPTDIGIANFQSGPHNRWAFSHIREILPTANIAHDSARVLKLQRAEDYSSDFSVEFQGKRQSIIDIARQQYIDGLLVLRDGKVVHEAYYGALTRDRQHLMMSQTKSVVGLLAGIFESRGLIDFDETVAHYVPELAGSGWGPDNLRTLLDMRDGADYTEDYEDLGSTVRLQDCAVGWGQGDHCPANGPKGGYEFYPTVGRNEDNLGRFVYKSGTTDALGWVLEAAGGAPLADLIAEYIWRPMGAEHDAYITVDSTGFALADGGMNATLRDMGRFGQLMLNRGEALGTQVVPAAFIDDIFLQSGDPEWPYPSGAGYEDYYRSQWWGHGNGEGDVSAAGIHGQYLHVAPKANIVVAVFSTWPRADGGRDKLGWESVAELSEAVIARWRKK